MWTWQNLWSAANKIKGHFWGIVFPSKFTGSVLHARVLCVLHPSPTGILPCLCVQRPRSHSAVFLRLWTWPTPAFTAATGTSWGLHTFRSSADCLATKALLWSWRSCWKSSRAWWVPIGRASFACPEVVRVSQARSSCCCLDCDSFTDVHLVSQSYRAWFSLWPCVAWYLPHLSYFQRMAPCYFNWYRKGFISTPTVPILQESTVLCKRRLYIFPALALIM